MTTVTSKPLRPSLDWPMLIGNMGMWLTITIFGLVWWAVNGGFSVAGLQRFAESFNDGGRIAWATISAWQITVPTVPMSSAAPGDAPALPWPTTQPIIPWIGVVASSLLQISVIWLRLSGRAVPPLLIAFACGASLYDYATTGLGLGQVTWLQSVPWAVQWIVAIPLTFGLEGLIGWMLPRRRRSAHG